MAKTKRPVKRRRCLCCNVDYVPPTKTTRMKHKMPQPPPIANKLIQQCYVVLENMAVAQATTAVEIPDASTMSLPVQQEPDVPEASTVSLPVQQEPDDSDVISIIDDSDDEDNDTTNNYIGTTTSIDVSSVVYLHTVSEQRINYLFPNYNPEKVNAMRSFFADPSAAFGPFARGEALKPADALNLIKKPQDWLSENVMNSYFLLIEQAMNGLVKCIKSFRLKQTKAKNEWSVEINIPFHKADPALFSRTALLIPFHFKKVHWTLVAVFFEAKVIIMYDSLDMCSKDVKYTNTVMEEVFRYMCSEAQRLETTNFDPEDWMWTTLASPTQQNQHDCGAFVCSYLWNMIHGKLDMFYGSDIPLIRQRMSYEFMKGELIECNRTKKYFNLHFYHYLSNLQINLWPLTYEVNETNMP